MNMLRSAPQSEETPELQGSKVPQNDGTDKGSVRTPPDISDTPNTSSLISSTVSYTRWHHIRKKKLGKSTREKIVTNQELSKLIYGLGKPLDRCIGLIKHLIEGVTNPKAKSLAQEIKANIDKIMVIQNELLPFAEANKK